MQPEIGEVAIRGSLAILNVGKGDTKLSFDPEKPAEVERANKVVTDMLRAGYAIMVQVGERDGKPLYMRAEGFDAKTNEYLIVGAPETKHEPMDVSDILAGTPRRKRQPKTTRVKASETRAVGVARMAGG